MPNDQKTVFISYRRDDSADITGRICDRLYAHFGRSAVFKDVDAIPLGLNFETYVIDKINQCVVLLAVIGPKWLTITDEFGQPRLDNSRDLARNEIEAALNRNIQVIPVLVQGAAMPKEKTLPPSLWELSKLNAAKVRSDPDFHKDMDSLVRELERWLKPVLVAEMAGQSPYREKQLTAEEYFNRALSAQNRVELDRAITDYTEALSVNPDFAEAYNNRGFARYNKGDFDGAMADYDRAIDLNPRLPIAHVNRGWARYNKGDLDGAMADYNRAIDLISGEFTMAFNNRGLVRQAKGDLEGAMADYDQTIRLDPRHRYAYNNRGEILTLQGNLEGVVANYDEALRNNPQDIYAYNNRGMARYAKGDLDGAIADFSEALRLNPQFTNPQAGLGDCNYDLKRYPEALDHYQRYLRLAGNNPSDVAIRRVQELKKMLGR